MARPVDPSELGQLGGDLRQEMSAMGADLRQEIHTSAEDLRTYVGQVVAELRQEIRDSGAEIRRHFDVVAEDLKSDVKAVAEGLGALDEKVGRFRGEVREDFGRVDRGLLHLEVRVIGRSDPA
jgi:hypothetical protein